MVVGGERHENGFGVTWRRERFSGQAASLAVGHKDRTGSGMHTNWYSPTPFNVFNSCSLAGTACSAVHPVLVSIRGAAAIVDELGIRQAATQRAAAVMSQ